MACRRSLPSLPHAKQNILPQLGRIKFGHAYAHALLIHLAREPALPPQKKNKQKSLQFYGGLGETKQVPGGTLLSRAFAVKHGSHMTSRLNDMDMGANRSMAHGTWFCLKTRKRKKENETMKSSFAEGNAPAFKL